MSLEAKGYRFKTKSDSEVIIYLYQEFGLGCLEHLRGEFAFLLYDRSRKLLVAARDRFGIKPLYFSRRAEGVVLGSEMKAIFASGLVEAKLNVAALDPFLDQDPDNVRFPFEGIEHVPPGCYMTIDLETLESAVTRYWSPAIPTETADPVPEPFDEIPDRSARSVLHRLEEAVALRLRADVPVGLYLSGGINSAFVGALMKRNLKRPLHSFSISFAGSDKNEQEFARKAANFIGTVHHELDVSKQRLWDHLEDCLWFSELPFVTLAPVGKFLLSQAAREDRDSRADRRGRGRSLPGLSRIFERAFATRVRSIRERPSKSAQLGDCSKERFRAAWCRAVAPDISQESPSPAEGGRGQRTV